MFSKKLSNMKKKNSIKRIQIGSLRISKIIFYIHTIKTRNMLTKILLLPKGFDNQCNYKFYGKLVSSDTHPQQLPPPFLCPKNCHTKPFVVIKQISTIIRDKK